MTTPMELTCGRCGGGRMANAECPRCSPLPDPTLGGILGPLPRATSAPSCTGAGDCPSGQHVHGCFADFGSCDNPAEHWSRAPAAPAAELPRHQVRVVMRETIEYELLVDTTEPRWSWLAETTENKDEWVAALDDECGQPDSVVVEVTRQMEPTDAWREVEHA